MDGRGPGWRRCARLCVVPGQPKHLLLGTTNSWLYESMDEGACWHRLAKLGSDDGFVLDSIVVDSADPATIYVGAWKNSHRRRIVDQPRPRPHLERAGAVQGPAGSCAGAGALGSAHSLCRNAGRSLPLERRRSHVDARSARRAATRFMRLSRWRSIPEIRDIVYAGTWHLPWKTADGGKTWHNIKQGLIVDSDVFSIIVDPEHTHTVYLSACSGIYKSENAGVLFHKIQGIPTEARRTRSLMQDPEKREVVYAGTTEGLYKTVNAGKTFKRMTDSDVVVNAVYVDPGDSNRVLLATDRGGVLVSHDGGATFARVEPGNLGAQSCGGAGGPRRSPAAVCGRGERQEIRRRVSLQRRRRALGAVGLGPRRPRRVRAWPRQKMGAWWREPATGFSVLERCRRSARGGQG